MVAGWNEGCSTLQPVSGPRHRVDASGRDLPSAAAPCWARIIGTPSVPRRSDEGCSSPWQLRGWRQITRQDLSCSWRRRFAQRLTALDHAWSRLSFDQHLNPAAVPNPAPGADRTYRVTLRDRVRIDEKHHHTDAVRLVTNHAANSPSDTLEEGARRSSHPALPPRTEATSAAAPEATTWRRPRHPPRGTPPPPLRCRQPGGDTNMRRAMTDAPPSRLRVCRSPAHGGGSPAREASATT